MDTAKYYKMYEEIKQLTAAETMQLILDAEDEEAREFFVVVGNFLLQKKQKQVIERNIF